MNYIKLLNAAFEKFFCDARLNPNHISLYMALFLDWNSSRFTDEFTVSRKELMTASKIGSKSTYHRCMKDLDCWEYLSYVPSKSPYKGSKIKMFIFGTDEETAVEQYSPILEQVAEQYNPKIEPSMGHYSPKMERYSPTMETYSPKSDTSLGHYSPTNGPTMGHYSPTTGLKMGSNINNTKQVNIIKQPKGWQVVINFFLEKSFNADEGKKFFEYYESRHWKTSDGKAIRDWRAMAANWMDRSALYSEANNPNKNQLSQIKDNLRTTKSKNYGKPL
ncbi:hypothetical protein LX77_02822 [Gelidibacter algens]|uniref:Uncharacterized protein n=1 Tax=Gelidibacter algens TaxID=49280 RepID=A0A327RWG7_9FLAO|nr:hypothetical protein [Gelidibacter algens]RAJ21069.1 hypothetical protein LX77_02822 [Gelidibacter algens]